jgi:hypothetical protein
MNISSTNPVVPSNYQKVKTAVQTCYATPLGKILLGFTALGMTASSANNGLSTEDPTARAGHAALGALGVLSAAFLTKEFFRAHGDDLRELRSILSR